ncbi:MAG: HAD hydrolase-like protein, partial [Synergistaceae bacterium]|nr:HAD hydrolase-like protein [Synergistaceae bacterium]
VDGVIEKYAIDCDCRKPKTGMIIKAEKDFNLDLERSIIIGDKEIDVLAGKNAGIGEKILIRSGHPIDEKNTVADSVFDGLYDFALFFKNRADQISPRRSSPR